ncbi:hypothetical protein DICSQDRAFT_174943 [Dichomitus squalens LYAD-421 SS1]|uniref:Homeobox domain-containing protein n=1 Tax=Dichomitus squalens (strain LYAD-421) TaxID=732165 RepID=R7SMY4_DICSQ|nr:uncharacterized protein DICSQDRAFT_174943 [Dichomitus squalens LYAD-421 SS1]EJF56362.1 hypothetical protein DICSQDRAFT_174943 [Dichomitus squalens LYAD-421 SS1]
MASESPSTSTPDALRWKPPLPPAVPVAFTDSRPVLAANGSPRIVNWDPRIFQRGQQGHPYQHISQSQAPRLPLPSKPRLASTHAATLQPERVAHKVIPHKGPLPQGAFDTLKFYFDNISQTPDAPARAMLGKRVSSMPGLAHYTAQDVCNWFATARKKQRRRERANPVFRARELPPQVARKENREQAKIGVAVESKPDALGWLCSAHSDINVPVPQDIRTVLFTQLTELMREDPNPSPEVAQRWAERLRPRMSMTYVLGFTRPWRTMNPQHNIRATQVGSVRSEPGHAPLPSSEPSSLTSQGLSRLPATTTTPPARQTRSHIPPPSNGSVPATFSSNPGRSVDEPTNQSNEGDDGQGTSSSSYAINDDVAHPQRPTNMNIASEHEDANIADESTAPARAPGAFSNHSISPVDGSRASILDIGQLAANLRMAFARSLVEERHRCPRTFVEFGAWLESLQ